MLGFSNLTSVKIAWTTLRSTDHCSQVSSHMLYLQSWRGVARLMDPMATLCIHLETAPLGRREACELFHESDTLAAARSMEQLAVLWIS